MTKLLGQLLGLWVSCVLSPTWSLMSYVLRDAFDLTAISAGPAAVIRETRHYLAYVHANPAEMMGVIVPELLLVLALSFGFMWACMWVSSWCVQTLASRLPGRLQNTPT